MSTQLVKRDEAAGQIERAIIGGDLSQLKPEERVSYYKMVCDSVGLNPLTKPFEYITLNGKLTLYARKDCTDQLRNINSVSIEITARDVVDDCFVVTTKATTPNGRTDGSIGAVSIAGLKGEAKCNAMMKAETKAKRRATLSICGLGLLDETEIETIPSARPATGVKVTEEDIEIVSPKSAAGNRPSGNVETHQEGVSTPLPAAAVPHSTAEEKLDGGFTGPGGGPLQVRASVPAFAKPPAVEYLASPQQLNFHKECNKAYKAVHPDKTSGDADIKVYQWLADHGYKDKDGIPTAALIPAAGWMNVREACIAWLKHQ